MDYEYKMNSLLTKAGINNGPVHNLELMTKSTPTFNTSMASLQIRGNRARSWGAPRLPLNYVFSSSLHILQNEHREFHSR